MVNANDSVSHAEPELTQRAEAFIVRHIPELQGERAEEVAEALAVEFTKIYDAELEPEHAMVAQSIRDAARNRKEKRALQDALARAQDTVATLSSQLRDVQGDKTP